MITEQNFKDLITAYGYECSDELAKKLYKLFSYDESTTLESKSSDFEFFVPGQPQLETQAAFMNLEVQDDGTFKSTFNLESAEYPSEEAFTWMLQMSGHMYLSDVVGTGNYWLLDLNDADNSISYWNHAHAAITAYRVMSLDELLERLDVDNADIEVDLHKDASDDRTLIFEAMKEILDIAWEGDYDAMQDILKDYQNTPNMDKLKKYLHK
jgi:hypothetical protein